MDASLAVVAVELDHDIYTRVSEVQDVLAGELAAGLASLHEQHEPLELPFGAAGVEGVDWSQGAQPIAAHSTGRFP